MHIWFESDTREACYLHETQFCQVCMIVNMLCGEVHVN